MWVEMPMMSIIRLIKWLAGRWRMARARWWAARCLARIRQQVGQRPVRVAFLVVENQKWSAQSVYAAMAASSLFEPMLFLSTHADNVGQDGRGALRTTLEQNVQFAKRHGFMFHEVFDERQGRFIPLENFSPDVVFYEQPYGLPPEHAPAVVSRFALTCYIPYGYGIYLARNSGQRFSPGFSEYIWRMFVESEGFLQMSGNIRFLQECSAVPTGYPKMDALRVLSEQRRQSAERATSQIIYAPHHSLTPGEGDSYGTFAWSGRWMLDFARSTPEITWIFKPHPKLREQLVRTGIMTPAEVNRYFAAWGELPNGKVVLDGGYMAVFADSDAMITDSGSFLVEFLITGNPILLLVSAKSAGYSAFGEKLVSTLYRATEVGEIRDFVESVVVGGNDHRRRERAAVTPEISGNSGRNVANYLERMFDSGEEFTRRPLAGNLS